MPSGKLGKATYFLSLCTPATIARTGTRNRNVSADVPLSGELAIPENEASASSPSCSSTSNDYTERLRLPKALKGGYVDLHSTEMSPHERSFLVFMRQNLSHKNLPLFQNRYLTISIKEDAF